MISLSSHHSGSIPAVPADAFTLFGWLALFDALRLVNERDPHRRLADIDSAAVAEFIGHRRDALLHHHLPQFTA